MCVSFVRECGVWISFLRQCAAEPCAFLMSASVLFRPESGSVGVVLFLELAGVVRSTHYRGGYGFMALREREREFLSFFSLSLSLMALKYV